MSYLIQNDYLKLIQADNLLAVINNDQAILNQFAATAQTEMISYLTQKYLVFEEFTDTNVYDPTLSYKAKNRVYLNANQYDPAAGTYAIGALTLNSGNVYICTTAVTAPATFNPASWSLLGAQYSFFYCILPLPPSLPAVPEFNYQCQYIIGNKVWWKDNVYTCKIASVVYGHDAQLQIGNIENIPLDNVFPDDPVFGLQYWGAPVPYIVPPESLLNPVYFIVGDNRNPQVVNFMIDITLYNAHSRIAPRNIPDLRVKRRDDAIEWLKGAAKGTSITANIPLRQPRQGGRIRFGGQVKRINDY